MEGCTLGSAVGEIVIKTWLVGIALGLHEGLAVEGFALGGIVDDILGVLMGLLEGLIVIGVTVRDAVGNLLGNTLGLKEGLTVVGVTLGDAVEGMLVGEGEGREVGTIVGFAVGVDVGDRSANVTPQSDVPGVTSWPTINKAALSEFVCEGGLEKQ